MTDDDLDDELNHSGLPKGPGPRMIDATAHCEELEERERDVFIKLIGRLRQRLKLYEPDTALDGAYPLEPVLLDLPRNDESSRIRALEHEVRVAEDANREHIRQKGRLRATIDELQRQVDDRLDGVQPTSPVPVVVAAPARDLAPLRQRLDRAVADLAAVARELQEPAEAAMIATERPAADPAPAPPVDRRRHRRGSGVEPMVIRGLRELGEATVEDLARHLGTSTGSIGTAIGAHASLIERRRDPANGKRCLYRLVSKATNAPNGIVLRGTDEVTS
jgi:hypothetical protein